MNNRGYLEFGMKMLDETRQLILLSIEEGFDREQKADEIFSFGKEAIQRVAAGRKEHRIYTAKSIRTSFASPCHKKYAVFVAYFSLRATRVRTHLPNVIPLN